MNAGSLLPRAAQALVVASAIAATLAYRDRLDVESFKAWLAGFGLLAPLTYLASYKAGTVVVPTGAGTGTSQSNQTWKGVKT